MSLFLSIPSFSRIGGKERIVLKMGQTAVVEQQKNALFRRIGDMKAFWIGSVRIAAGVIGRLLQPNDVQ